jgi:hypothetical protein
MSDSEAYGYAYSDNEGAAVLLRCLDIMTCNERGRTSFCSVSRLSCRIVALGRSRCVAMGGLGKGAHVNEPGLGVARDHM